MLSTVNVLTLAFIFFIIKISYMKYEPYKGCIVSVFIDISSVCAGLFFHLRTISNRCIELFINRGT